VRYEYLIATRYLQARRRERFVSLIAIISLVGVFLGTFAMATALSMMSGFQVDLRQRLLAFTPQVVVERADQQVWNPAELEQKIEHLPGVAAVAPFLSSQIMAVAQNDAGVPSYVSGGILRGVVAQNNPVLTELQKTLETGSSLASLDQTRKIRVTDKSGTREVDLPGMIVGKTLALDLGLRLGDPVVLVSPASLGGGIGGPRLRRFVVTGFFYSGMYEFDSSLIFVALKNGRALLADDPEMQTGLELRLDNMFDAPAIARRIAAMTGPGFTVTDWTRENAPLFNALQEEKFAQFVVLLLIVLVAAFNIIATLVMVVMERRKEIAILRAMGARAASIASIFLYQGALLGLVGTACGISASLLFCWLQGKYHLIRLPADMFMISYVPVRVIPFNFAAVATAAVALCVVAALYPALKARSLSPVEVIRYE
jgi:lipoprotein-releasing system permease protein